MLFPQLRANLQTGLVPFIFIFLSGLFLSSCEYREGSGGTGSISGTIMEHFYTEDFSTKIYENPAIEEEVFIYYGEDHLDGDKTVTSVNGDFRFKFLYPGRYSIYYRSLDSTRFPDDEWTAVRTVELDRGEDLDLGKLVKLNTLKYDDGAATIRGVITKIKYVDESRWPNLVEEYRDFAHEHEVYLIYGDRTFYEERVRAQYNGVFEFANLIPGKYTVFLYSEDVTRVLKNVVKSYEVTITEWEQVEDLGMIFIEEL
jgi:hypothetical protein